MPAETHRQSDPVDTQAILDLLADLVGMDVTSAARAHLVDLRLDDDLSILDLWDAVVEEYGERCVGDLDLSFDERRPTRLSELAQWFAHLLGDERRAQPAPQQRPQE